MVGSVSVKHTNGAGVVVTDFVVFRICGGIRSVGSDKILIPADVFLFRYTLVGCI